MADRSPSWVVVVTDETPANVSRVKCLRCGDVNDVTLPMNVIAWVARVESFAERHAKCK